jgi:DNA-binding CsgD family transcriptional regulator
MASRTHPPQVTAIPGSEAGGVHPLEVVSARRLERLLMRVRYLMALLVVAMVVLFDPVSIVGALALAAALIGLNVAGHLRLPDVDTLPRARRFAAWAVGTDSLAAVGIYLLFLPDPAGMPVALLVFLVFEFSLRFSWPAAAVGMVLFLGARGGRAYVQGTFLDQGEVRPALLVLWAAVAVLMIAVSRELQTQEVRWRSALEERERVAGALRATVTQTLVHAGIDERAAPHADVMSAVHEILASDGDDREQLIAHIANVLAVPHHGLSPREQEILLLLARGHNDARIAAALFISPSTVRNHLHNMRTKLGLPSRDELRAFASRYAPMS